MGVVVKIKLIRELFFNSQPFPSKMGGALIFLLVFCYGPVWFDGSERKKYKWEIRMGNVNV